jgi:hypothetical protein
MVADVVSALAKLRDGSFDKSATGFAFVAALIDPAFKRRLTELHRRLDAHHWTKSKSAAASIATLFRDLEAAAEAIVSGLWEMEERVESRAIRAQDGADLPIRVRKPRAGIKRAQRGKLRSKG